MRKPTLELRKIKPNEELETAGRDHERVKII